MTTAPSAEPQSATFLRGQAALNWFHAQGHSVTGDAEARVSLEELSTSGFRIARTWHSPATIRIENSDDNATIILQAEGETLIERAGEGYRDALHPGGIALLSPGRSYSLSVAEPVARYEVSIGPKPIRELIDRKDPRGFVIDEPSKGFYSMLVSVINSAFNFHIKTDDLGFPAFQMAISQLTSGLLIEAIGINRYGGSLREEQLWRQAQEIITRRSTDPSFSVAILAQELRIANRYLQRIFASHQTAPSIEIRAVRAAIARNYLRPAGTQSSSFRAEDVARLSGFNSVSSMRRAMSDGARPGAALARRDAI